MRYSVLVVAMLLWPAGWRSAALPEDDGDHSAGCSIGSAVASAMLAAMALARG